MNESFPARAVIRAVRSRARRMPHAIELLLSPDDAQALLDAWRLAETCGIQFLPDGVMSDGRRFRIGPQMRARKQLSLVSEKLSRFVEVELSS
jgi:hypothetical protein